mmetsp:Transcript_109180/g.282196  ORF Transcript_109180/g.282196 Transcript_109180/m.282196 type:complete len:323 (+) Transcript_109180:1588-2556(+)
MVLVVALSVPEDWEAWELDAILRGPPKVGLHRTLLVDQTTPISPGLSWVHAVYRRRLLRGLATTHRGSVVGLGVQILVVNVCDLQAVRQLVEHLVRLREPVLVERLVYLHGDHASETVGRIPDIGRREATRLNPLNIIVHLQGRVVKTHSCDGAPQGLHPHRGPDADLVPLVLLKVVPGHASDVHASSLHAVDEGPILVLVPVPEPIDQRDHLSHGHLAEPPELHVRAARLVVGTDVVELTLGQDDRLPVVRDHDRDPGDVRRPEGPRHRQPEAAREGVQAPLEVLVSQRLRPTAIVPPSNLRQRQVLKEVRHGIVPTMSCL